MSQFNPREDNGYPRQVDSVGVNGDPSVDATDANGSHPQAGSQDFSVHFCQVVRKDLI
jgi:hypothetical protein